MFKVVWHVAVNSLGRKTKLIKTREEICSSKLVLKEDAIEISFLLRIISYTLDILFMSKMITFNSKKFIETFN